MITKFSAIKGHYLIRRDLFVPPTISPGPTGPVLRVDTTAFKPGYGSVDPVMQNQMHFIYILFFSPFEVISFRFVNL